MAFGFHGLKVYPSVYMSESERIPDSGRDPHVPPMASRPSRIA